MKLFIDTDNRKLVRSDTDSSTASKPSFTLGDNEPIELVLLTKGTVAVYDPLPTSAGDSVKIAIGRFDKEPRLLSMSDASMFDNSGKSTIALPLYTQPMADALKTVASLSAKIEIEMTHSDGKITTLYQGDCVLRSELITKDVPPSEISSNFYTKGETQAFVASSLKSGVISEFNSGDLFVGKTAISPTSKKFLMYCEDGKWHQLLPVIQDGVPMLTLSEDTYETID